MKWTDEGFLEFEKGDCGFEYAQHIFSLDRINQLIREEMGKWPVVYGSNKRPLDGWNEAQYESTTQTARLTPPRAIQKDSLEQLAYDLNNIDAFNLTDIEKLKKRARKLLGEK